MGVHGMHREASIEINASPEAVYDLVSDLPRMGEWSPENLGGEWQGSGRGRVGDRFIGHNRTSERAWSVPVMVTFGAGVSCTICQWPLPVIDTLTEVPSPSVTVAGWVSEASTVPSGGTLLLCTGMAPSSSTRGSNVSNSTGAALRSLAVGLLRLPPRPRVRSSAS